jgi:hypothetical protein
MSRFACLSTVSHASTVARIAEGMGGTGKPTQEKRGVFKSAACRLGKDKYQTETGCPFAAPGFSRQSERDERASQHQSSDS